MYKEFNPKEWQVLSSSNKTINNINIYNDDVDKLIETIESIGVDITQGYETWRNIAFALINKFGASARSYFHRISKFHSKYDYQTCNTYFDGFLNSKGSGLTIRSLFWIAKQNGVVINQGNINLREKKTIIKKPCLNDVELTEFPVHVFPDVIQEFIHKSAESINCPEDFIAFPILVTFAMSMTSNRLVHVKEGWQEFPILYSAIVAHPGAKKSPALKQALLPLQKAQYECELKYREQFEKYSESLDKYEYDLSEWKSLNRNDQTINKKPIKPRSPNLKQFQTTDATPEGITDILHKQNSGILCFMDELSGWLKGMNQYKSGKGNEMEKWLKWWTADQENINRKGKDPIFIKNVVASVIGGIQPDMLDLFKGKNNGLIDRFLFIYPEEIQPMITDVEVSVELSDRLYAIFDTVYKAHHNDEDLESETKISKFSRESFLALMDYANSKLYPDMVSPHTPYYLRGPMSKSPGYIARFALIIQALKFGNNESSIDEIELDSLNKAIEINEYFLKQAKKTYARINTSSLDKKIEIAERWINKNGGQASAREIYTNKVAGCKNTKDTMSLFEEMADRELGTIKEISAKGGGRSKLSFILEENVCNPLESLYNFN